MSEQIAQRIETSEPVVAPLQSTEVKETENVFDTVVKPPSIMEQPYLVKMFELGMAKDHFEMPTLIKEVNDFVMSELKRQNLDDNVKSYEEIVNHYLKKLNLPENIDVYTKVEKLIELMRIDKKLLDATREKEELLKKPITELTSKQLEARINAKSN